MKILAIDPGTYASAYVILEDGKIDEAQYLKNEEMQGVFANICHEQDVGIDVRCYCEAITPRPKMGKETIDTAMWIGQYKEMCRYYGLHLILIDRNTVTSQLGCKKSSKFTRRPAMDTQVKHKMQEQYGKTCLDYIPSKQKSHVFQALGLASEMYNLIQEGIHEMFEL